MSLNSWCKEFYPRPASVIEKQDALQHSLRKWQGLLRKNLRKHGLENFFGALAEVDEGDGGEIRIDGSTCALCHHHYKKKEAFERRCEGCPLYEVRGKVACDVERDDEGASPYDELSLYGDARPMIMWLKRAIKAQG